MVAGLIIVFVVVWIVIKAASGITGGNLSGVPAVARILRKGVPARGILLSVSSTSAGSVGVAPMRYQLRDCVMDIEIPGRPPYEAQVRPYIPSNLARDILPGATVELRVDPRQPTQVVVVGPGVGFNAALLNAGSMQGGQ